MPMMLETVNVLMPLLLVWHLSIKGTLKEVWAWTCVNPVQLPSDSAQHAIAKRALEWLAV